LSLRASAPDHIQLDCLARRSAHAPHCRAIRRVPPTSTTFARRRAPRAGSTSPIATWMVCRCSMRWISALHRDEFLWISLVRGGAVDPCAIVHAAANSAAPPLIHRDRTPTWSGAGRKRGADRLRRRARSRTHPAQRTLVGTIVYCAEQLAGQVDFTRPLRARRTALQPPGAPGALGVHGRSPTEAAAL